MAAIHLSNPVKDLYGVGPAAEEKLAKLDIYTIYDLIAFIPWRYDDWSHVGTIGSFDMNDRFADNRALISHSEEPYQPILRSTLRAERDH